MDIRAETVVFLENEPGTPAHLAQALAEKGIGLEGFTVHEGVDHGVIRMVTSDPRKAAHVLGEGRMLSIEVEVLRVPLRNRAGELARLAALRSGK